MSITRLIHASWQSFASQVIGRVQSPQGQVNQPIFQERDILLLADELQALGAKLPINSKQSDALRQGEQSSRYMGTGMEYEESRPYEVGDEIRRINWRLMAKTGQAYTKLFQEERQENWFILVDHRNAMRFGTRVRLKATQAARVAGYYAWIAQQAGIPVAVGRLAETFEQSPIYEGRSSYAQVMKQLNQPCPPIDAKHETGLNDVLLSLSHRLQAGSRLIVVSDFHDVDSKTREILTAMQDFLLIKTVMIKDASESGLPDVSGLQLQSTVNKQSYQIHSQSQREQYQAWSKDYFLAIASTLRGGNATYYEVSAESSISQVNKALSETIPNSGAV